MNLTDEQHAICQAARDLGPHSWLKIQAFAGTGKTTTLAAIAESLAQRKFLYLVFNRAAADEAEQKMPSNVTVRTAHAVAFRSVGRVYRSRLASSPWAWFPYLREKMPRALDSVVHMGRDSTSAGALIIRTLEQFLRTTHGAIGAIHAPYWCDDNVAATAGYAAEALWKNICKQNSTAPVTHDCYLKLFYLQGRDLAPPEWTVMLDEAQDADPVILGLLERYKGARIVVGDKYQQLYQWRGAVNALARMRSDSAELSLTRTFRFGKGAAEWSNRVLEVLGEKLRIIPARHRTTVSIEEKSVKIDALLARTNVGTLDAAIHGLERRRKVHVMGGAGPLIKLIRGAWDLHLGNPSSGELAMFASWDELKAAAKGDKDGSPGDPALQVLVRLIEKHDRKVLLMCRQLEACVDSPAGAQITVSTVHKAKGLEWPRVLISSDFNQFVKLENGKPTIDLEEAYVMYVALTRAREKLILSPACVKAISASAAMKAGLGRKQHSPGT
ncbi:MAG: 3'-5' exonuclease [Candidatus Binatus sp.]|uniref:3'-5' exonuclease n=1 Tax=Candidatus Binatus sp. TaxID=2811406 RepID=UPI0027286893|nr:3'-5' exonuclease [Candidatus Binatus sp.]MDO8430920.1 3'-5' exonuclease [Candidatus Binatus sp.]